MSLSIGDIHQGGIIFYLDGKGGGLIAAATDQSPTGPTDNFSEGAEWGCYKTGINGADNNAIGTGAQNTTNIVNASCSPIVSTNLIAANICANLTLGGYNDWFLPSKDELNLMFDNIGQGNALGLGNVGGFEVATYWSSSEYDKDYAWVQFFDYGFQCEFIKFSTNYVRAVRAF